MPSHEGRLEGCRRNKPKLKVDRHGYARYSGALMMVGVMSAPI
ncbi:MAG TPA: hypothetical protein VLA32_03705 [Anaerolineales bacterium]|nr:hypothetical protein [Anaerolineales bacterium]